MKKGSRGDEGPREDEEMFQRLTLTETSRKTVLKERNPWLTRTESCESEKGSSGRARSSHSRNEDSRSDALVPDWCAHEGGEPLAPEVETHEEHKAV